LKLKNSSLAEVILSSIEKRGFIVYDIATHLSIVVKNQRLF